MAKKKSRAKPKMTLPIAVIAPLAATVITEPSAGWNSLLNMAQAGMWQNVADILLNGWLFYDRQRQSFDLNKGLFTKLLLLGTGVHWVAGKAGVNRALGRAKVPLIRI